ncbi:hypothetical protein EH31_16160 [Erythrobacter longus]|uniref:histidine kinase n=1 Tax=Erythrobacter longus TaxID=1044 RepID=A0A074MA36_ERYLO|nr:sensor histidine kinase [Erythrobacter longus]KEO88688.1 hypothetical protein EH31_16160 [Erythrobacter longus]
MRGEDGRTYNRTVEPYRSKLGGIIATYLPVETSTDEEGETRSDFLMRELDHRVKNMLAIILSIAEITARSNTDISTYKNDFRARLESMARTHNLLAQAQWSGLEFRALVEEELFAIAPRQAITIEGPELSISPVAAQSLAMFLHELAANAAKYGALASDVGAIAIAWEIQPGAGGAGGAGDAGGAGGALILNWQESGGPSVTPPEREGFGGKVINRLFKRQLEAEVQTRWDASGIQLEAKIPLSSLTVSKA